ncbi:MAG: hypothetical protein IMY73_02905 [Bacteroidetes bacterium]|nr:hypothetical protein [Bacteroidota bacterium]
MTEEELNNIIGGLKDNEDTIYSLTERAKKYKQEKKFSEAECIWKKLSEKVKNEIYYIQQQAFCRYKSGKPTKCKALTDALKIIESISESTDTETLGITGAINKGLWEEVKDESYLNEALKFYKKGWNLHEDYYTGENYAFCCEQKSLLKKGEQKIFYEYNAKMIREEIILILLDSLKEEQPNDVKWKYATLSNCYLAIGKQSEAEDNEKLFLKENPIIWEIETFNKSKKYINEYLKINK